MKNIENWIWLPKKLYPNNQTTIHSAFLPKDRGNYTVAEFKRTYKFNKQIKSVALRFSGDTFFQLFCNNELVATGPASVGGDFIGNDELCDNYYAFEKEICPDENNLDFFAQVRMMPVQICEYSKGCGGFMLSATVSFTDGTKELIATDESWLARKNSAYNMPFSYDERLDTEPYTCAELKENIWHTKNALIPPREENIIFPEGCEIELLPNEEKEVVLELDRIYAGFIGVDVQTSGTLFCEIACRELEENVKSEKLVFAKNGTYRGLSLRSAGNLLVRLNNSSAQSSKIKIYFIETHYPVYEIGSICTNDNELNQVLDVCQHTLKQCRQTHHLDSPRHCEPLACTGDYYIESLMTIFSFGDMRLAEFDILRTDRMLKRRNGRMFHTTYSLIWVRMLYDVYMATGNKKLLEECRESLALLLNLFRTYIGKNGLIETPPNYMFVDWIYIDGLSMHHPPKALGQTALNMFYFGALDFSAKIFTALNDKVEAEKCEKEREELRTAINTHLFDKEKRIYFEGLNTPTEEKYLHEYMPQNVNKRYYLKHSNILSAYFGVADDSLSKELIEKIMSDEIEGEYQPYFAHYLLEAIYRCDLREKYTLRLLERWKKPTLECPKGLVEGFIPPEPTYTFDHSHAWGGTPLYSLPKALLGFEILSSGMKEIRLNPTLLGLKNATVRLPTPYGEITVSQKDGEKPKIKHPKNINITLT